MGLGVARVRSMRRLCLTKIKESAALWSKLPALSNYSSGVRSDGETLDGQRAATVFKMRVVGGAASLDYRTNVCFPLKAATNRLSTSTQSGHLT